MMACSIFILYVFMSVNQVWTLVNYTKGYATFGKTFVIALPALTKNTSVNFFLHTLNFETFNVTYSVRWGRFTLETSNHTMSRSVQQMVTSAVSPFSSVKSFEVRFTYILKALYPFQVNCLVYEDSNVMAGSFLAIPMEAWGDMYVIVTPSYMASVQVINGNKEQEVTLTFVPMSFDINKTEFRANEELISTYFLLSFQAISLQLCSNDNKMGTFSGSQATAYHPFAIITGNCHYCRMDSVSKRCLSDINLEMLPAMSSFATTFYTAKPIGLAGYFLVIAQEPCTSFTVDGSTHRIDCNSTTGKFVTRLGNLEGPHLIISESTRKPILVVLFLRSSGGRGKEAFDTSMSYMVPSGLFMDNYYWINPFDDTDNYVVVVFKDKQSSFIDIDDRPINTISFYNESKFCDHAIGQFSTTRGSHRMYSVNSFRFGAYLYGYRKNDSMKKYMSPAGLVAKPGYWPGCDHYDRALPEEGDLIDNDCDGFVDEERRDLTDNDNDRKIDEDKGRAPLTDGQWSPWSHWHCEGDASKMSIRQRLCNNPAPSNGGYYCVGKNFELEEADCEALKDNAVNGDWMILEYSCMGCDAHSTKAKIIRQCVNPEPLHGGKDCPGPDEFEMDFEPCKKFCSRLEGIKPSKQTKPPPCSNTTHHNRRKVYKGELKDVSTTSSITDFLPITEVKKLPGIWGSWSQWECLRNCSVKEFVRKRPCLDPPSGPRYFDCLGFDYELHRSLTCNSRCATECPRGRWGYNCTMTCEHCETHCDEITGHCSRCKPGYRYPHTACDQECKEFTFGNECLGDCRKTCEGRDCVDRIDGKCPVKRSKLWYLLMLVAFPAVVLVSIWKNREKYRENHFFEGIQLMDESTTVEEGDSLTSDHGTL